jgi:hypothetical protein
MDERLKVPRAPLPWLVGGLALALVQMLAFAVNKPLGVSTQFAVLNGVVLHEAAPEYAAENTYIGGGSTKKYSTFGYGWWLDVGLVAGALVAAVAVRRWRPRVQTAWWQSSHGPSTGKRLLAGLVGGFLILFGARMGHGCTSGQFASGWAQLSVSAIPFTVTLFGFGMITARIFHPKVPEIER